MEQLLSTKLYIPRSRPKLVTRPRLIQQLNEGPRASHTAGVTLISAPVLFWKTTRVSEWVNVYGLQLTIYEWIRIRAKSFRDAPGFG